MFKIDRGLQTAKKNLSKLLSFSIQFKSLEYTFPIGKKRFIKFDKKCFL